MATYKWHSNWDYATMKEAYIAGKKEASQRNAAAFYGTKSLLISAESYCPNLKWPPTSRPIQPTKRYQYILELTIH